MGEREKHLYFNCCSEPCCTEPAGFRAPVVKRVDGEIDYGLFCKIHARERNGKWNYFADMSADEIEEFRHQSYSWHRSTTEQFSTAVHAAVHSTEFLGEDVLFATSGISAASMRKPAIPPEIKRALHQMHFDEIPDETALKAQFRRLVKQYHPDVQPESPRNLECLQNINSAYKSLKEYLCREMT